MAYGDNDIELNDDFWLAKRYQEKALEETSGEQNPTSPQNGVFIVGYDLLFLPSSYANQTKSKSRVQRNVG